MISKYTIKDIIKLDLYIFNSNQNEKDIFIFPISYCDEIEYNFYDSEHYKEILNAYNERNKTNYTKEDIKKLYIYFKEY